MIILSRMIQYSEAIQATNEGKTDPVFLAGMEMAFVTGATAIASLALKVIEECTPENCNAFFQSLKAETDAITTTITTRDALDKMKREASGNKPEEGDGD